MTPTRLIRHAAKADCCTLWTGAKLPACLGEDGAKLLACLAEDGERRPCRYGGPGGGPDAV